MDHLRAIVLICFLVDCNMLEYEDVVLCQTYKYNNDYYIFTEKQEGRYKYINIESYSKRLKYGYIDKDDWYYRRPDGEYAFLFINLVLTQASFRFLRLVIKFVFGGL